MKDHILKAIEEYTNEPAGLIRAIPDPEVLAEWICESIRKNLI